MEDGAQRRRSPRLAAPPLGCGSEMAAVKRSITVKKIVPRKTVAPSDHDKENTPGRRPSDARQKKPRVSTPDRGPPSSCVGPKQQRRSAAAPSPILASPPPASSCQQPAADPEDAAWSRKARRSYSRLSGRSPGSPGHRETLFGFERLKTPEVLQGREQSRTALEATQSGLGSFTSLLEAEEAGEPDPNIPGVVLVKEKRRRRRKVQDMDSTELDVLAARMNAEFLEAEEFQLVVE